jgi:hypothetical protein
MMLEDTRRLLAKEDAVADAVHRRAFGDDYSPPSDEEMGTIHVGDTIIHHAAPAPVASSQSYPMPQQPSMSNAQQPQAKSNLPAVALAALLSTVGGGLAGYYFGGKNQSDVPAFDDESVRIGLGRIEDYKQGGE